MKLLTLILRSSCRLNSSKITQKFYHENNLCGDYALAAETNIKDVLQTFSVPFTDGHTCFLVNNCFCYQSSSNFSNSIDIFINKQTGFFLCQRCRITGDWSSFKNLLTKATTNKSDLGVFKENFEKYDGNLNEWSKVEKSTESLSYMKDDTFCNVLSEFKLTHCSRSVIEQLNIRISYDKCTLFFPLYCSESVVGFKTISKNNEESTTPRINSPGLLILSKPFTQFLNAVVVDSVASFLALASINLHKYDVICLPYGTRHVPQASLPFFEKYKKIILWLGVNSIDVIGNIAKKFNEKRCYVIKPVENQITPSVALAKKENILNILSTAKLTYHQFVTTFSSFREDLFAQLQNKIQLAGVPWKRFPQLTKILKGHRRGELTILTGPTGVGKTTFLSEYSLDLAMQGVNTLWGSFEIKNIRLARIMLTQFAGVPLPVNPLEFNSLCDKFEQLPIFFLTFHGHQDLEQVMDALYHCSYTYDIAHVLIDNVQFMMDVSPECARMDRFWRQDYMVQMFRNFASKHNCHMTLVMHPKKTEGTDLAISSIFGGVKASQEADNIMIIQNRPGSNFKSEKYLEIAKNRYFGDLGAFPLVFDKPSLSFSMRSLQNQTVKFFMHEKENNTNSSDEFDDLKVEPTELKSFHS